MQIICNKKLLPLTTYMNIKIEVVLSKQAETLIVSESDAASELVPDQSIILHSSQFTKKLALFHQLKSLLLNVQGQMTNAFSLMLGGHGIIPTCDLFDSSRLYKLRIHHLNFHHKLRSMAYTIGLEYESILFLPLATNLQYCHKLLYNYVYPIALECYIQAIQESCSICLPNTLILFNTGNYKRLILSHS